MTNNNTPTTYTVFVTDAWEPQVSGVVTTLKYVKLEFEKRNHQVRVIAPDPKKYFIQHWLPGHPEIPLAIWPKPGKLWVDQELDALRREGTLGKIYIATPEGPLGISARLYCLKHDLNYSTGAHTRFDDFTSALPIPVIAWAAKKYGHEFLKWAHKGAYKTLVLNQGMIAEYQAKGFENLVPWTRGVDTNLFKPGSATVYDGLPRPIFLNVGRISYEKGLGEFENIELPGTTVFVGTGPILEELQKKLPHGLFAGLKRGDELAAYYRSADVFAFPSVTDTFGNVQIEALASGLPIAALPNSATESILSVPGIGVMNANFKTACLEAYKLRQNGCAAACRQHVMKHYNGWERTAQILDENTIASPPPRRSKPTPPPVLANSAHS